MRTFHSALAMEAHVSEYAEFGRSYAGPNPSHAPVAPMPPVRYSFAARRRPTAGRGPHVRASPVSAATSAMAVYM